MPWTSYPCNQYNRLHGFDHRTELETGHRHPGRPAPGRLLGRGARLRGGGPEHPDHPSPLHGRPPRGGGGRAPRPPRLPRLRRRASPRRPVRPTPSPASARAAVSSSRTSPSPRRSRTASTSTCTRAPTAWRPWPPVWRPWAPPASRSSTGARRVTGGSCAIRTLLTSGSGRYTRSEGMGKPRPCATGGRTHRRGSRHAEPYLGRPQRVGVTQQRRTRNTSRRAATRSVRRSRHTPAFPR